MTMATQKRGGRKKGSKNLNLEEVTTVKTKCPKCNSVRRGPFTKTTRQPFNDEVIIRRWTKCLKCGQCRIDREVVKPD